MIIVAIAALIGGRAYHVIDQWALYKDDPIKIFLPPYSGLGVYGGILTGTIAAFLYARYKKAPFLRWADIVAPGPVRDAGHRALGQLLQPGAVRAADDACRGASRSTAPIASRTYPCPPVPVETTRFQPLFLYESISGAARRARAHLARLPPAQAAAAGRPAARSSSSGTGSSGSLSRRSASTTGRSSASRPPRSCRSRSSSRRCVILLWRHRPGHPLDDPADRPGGRDVGRHRAAGRPRSKRDRPTDDDRRRRRGLRRRRRVRRRRIDDADEDDETDEDDDEPEDDDDETERSSATSATRRDRDRRARRRDRRAAAGAGDGPSRPSLRWPIRTRPDRRRRRPPPGADLAARRSPPARGGAVEGLAWLGRAPEAKASILYRLLRLVARFVLFVVFRFRIRTSGPGAPAARRLPAGRGGAPRLDGPVRRDARASRPSRAPGSSAAARRRSRRAGASG